VRHSIEKNLWRRYDDSNVEQGGIPGLLVGPGLDVIFSSEELDLNRGYLISEDIILLIAELNCWCNEPDELRTR